MSLQSQRDTAALFLDADTLHNAAGEPLKGWLGDGYVEAGGTESSVPQFVTAASYAEQLGDGVLLTNQATGDLFRVRGVQLQTRGDVITVILERQRSK